MLSASLIRVGLENCVAIAWNGSGRIAKTPDGLDMLKSFKEIVPRPDHKASGEERAWGRRFAKRFGVSPLRYADRTFTVKGDGSPPLVIDHESLKPEAIKDDVRSLFEGVDVKNGDQLVAFGWAMSEDLAKLV